MFKALLYKEILESYQGKRLLLAFLLCAVIIPTGLYNNYKRYTVKQTFYQESIRLYEESHATVQDMMQRGAEVYRSPSPLSMVANGIEELLPTSIESVGFFTYRGANTQFVNTRSIESPNAHLYGSLDLTVIVVIIMSVLAMLFSFNSIAGEKESGSLGLILSNPVPRTLILSTKTIANCLIVVGVFTVGVLIGLFLLSALGSDILTNANLLRNFILSVVVIYIYLIVFVFLGVMVSSSCKSSILSIVLLLCIWVFFFMIYPKGSVIAAKMIHPVKSQQVINLEKNQKRIQHDNEVNSAIDELLASSDALSGMSISEFRKNLQANGEKTTSYVAQQREIQEYHKTLLREDLERIETFYAHQKRAQMALAKNIARVSPVSCFVHILTELSRTGLLEYRQWQVTHFDFKRTLDEQLCSYYEPSMRFKNFSSGNFSGDRDAAAPRFITHPVSLKAIFSEVWIDLVILVLYGLFFFIAAHVLFMRYDVR